MRRQAPWRRGSRAAALVVGSLLGALAACRERPVDETQVLVAGLPYRCRYYTNRGLRVNRYAVLLLEHPSPSLSRDPEDNDCVTCLQERSCRGVLMRRCRCGPNRPLGARFVQLALEGLRFEDLDPERRYCLVLLAWQAPRPGPDPEQDCSCEQMFREPLEPRICGLTLWSGGVGPSAAAHILAVECEPSCPLFLLSAEGTDAGAP